MWASAQGKAAAAAAASRIVGIRVITPSRTKADEDVPMQSGVSYTQFRGWKFDLPISPGDLWNNVTEKAGKLKK